ncbi:heterokaryon incompatibility protein-domain-containing protein [Xylariaceae sp. FL0016]|nr:heterokaryon incompatibility protein-domain-containing protein [Xylariaceae sp. FL0016]
MAANQSRRRAEAVESDAVAATRSLYRPLDQNVDCIRLVKIHPAEQQEGPVVCSLVHVTFAERPKYEALSYRWGDDKDMVNIVIDGVTCPVRRNLWDALCFLQSHQNDKSMYWMDALSINQSDISERSAQLRIMRHIYFRAQAVVIWLGKKYLTYQKYMTDSSLQQHISHQAQAAPPTSPESDSDKRPASDQDVEHPHISPGHESEYQMVKELCQDGYWHRLWIIQEISQGQGTQYNRLKVCFGKLVFRWDLFIHMLTMHNCNDEAPLRLHQQLQESGHTLRGLLVRYEGAKCADPKDKIYGLIGLAADARDFPTIDYKKSTYEIWEDTMVFMNKYKMLHETEIVPFGHLVKKLLKLDVCTPMQNVIRPFELDQDPVRMTDMESSRRVFKVRGCVLGYVMDVGPSARQVVESLTAAEWWECRVQQNYPDDLGRAHQESVSFLRRILDDDQFHKIADCKSHSSAVRWEAYLKDYGRQYAKVRNHLQEYCAEHQYPIKPADEHHEDNTEAVSIMYQLKIPRRDVYGKYWADGDPSCKMGVASKQARPGDLICLVQGIRRAVVIRNHGLMDHYKDTISLQVYGTALTTKTLLESESQGSQSPAGSSLEYSLEVKMDAKTLFVLLS